MPEHRYSNLSKEQKELLFWLLGADNWETGEELAQKLCWNRKKLQTNMNYLIEELKGECMIESQKNKGYLLISISDELRTCIIQDVNENGAYFNLDERCAMLVIDLMFRRDYVSMEKLAEEYFLSKTSVFKEISRLKRWFGRMNDLELEVSSKKGIRIWGSENSKRYCCASYIQMNMLKLIGLDQLAIMRYQGVMKSSSGILKKYLSDTGNMISGEDFSLILRYIGMTQLRSSMGYLLEESCAEGEAVLLLEFFHILSEATGYTFTGMEKTVIMKMIQGANRLAVGRTALKPSELYESFKNHICRKCNLEHSLFGENDKLLAHNFESMIKRSVHHKHFANFYDKDILRRYPLAYHLTTQAFREMKLYNIARSDLLDIALYVGGILENAQNRSKIKILLAGNQNFQILDHIRQYLCHMMPGMPETFELCPCYMLDYIHEAAYDLFLTTEPEVILKNQKFILVPVIMTSTNLDVLRKKVKTWFMEHETSRCEKIRGEIIYTQIQKIDSLEALIPREKAGQVTEYVIDGSTLVMICGDSTGQGMIKIHKLEELYSYEYHSISQIIWIQYDERRDDVIEYFEILSRVLQTL